MAAIAVIRWVFWAAHEVLTNAGIGMLVVAGVWSGLLMGITALIIWTLGRK